MSAKLRVVALVHRHLIPPDTIEEGAPTSSWRRGAPEHDVISTLTGLGHEVKALGRPTTTSAKSAGWSPSGSRTSPSICSRASTTSRSLDQERGLATSRAAEALLHGLQSARAPAGARQIALEEAPRLPTHRRARVRVSCRCRPAGALARSELPFPLMVKSLTQEKPHDRDLTAEGVGGRLRRTN